MSRQSDVSSLSKAICRRCARQAMWHRCARKHRQCKHVHIFFSTDYCNDYLNAAWISWFDLDPWLRSRIMIQKFNQSSLVLRMYHRRVPFVHPEESLRQTKEPAHIFLSLEGIFGKLQGSTSECCCSSILEHMFYRQHHTEVIPGSLQICIYIKTKTVLFVQTFFPAMCHILPPRCFFAGL